MSLIYLQIPMMKHKKIYIYFVRNDTMNGIQSKDLAFAEIPNYKKCIITRSVLLYTELLQILNKTLMHLFGIYVITLLIW